MPFHASPSWASRAVTVTRVSAASGVMSSSRTWPKPPATFPPVPTSRMPCGHVAVALALGGEPGWLEAGTHSSASGPFAADAEPAPIAVTASAVKAASHPFPDFPSMSLPLPPDRSHPPDAAGSFGTEDGRCRATGEVTPGVARPPLGAAAAT